MNNYMRELILRYNRVAPLIADIVKKERQGTLMSIDTAKMLTEIEKATIAARKLYFMCTASEPSKHGRMREAALPCSAIVKATEYGHVVILPPILEQRRQATMYLYDTVTDACRLYRLEHPQEAIYTQCFMVFERMNGKRRNRLDNDNCEVQKIVNAISKVFLKDDAPDCLSIGIHENPTKTPLDEEQTLVHLIRPTEFQNWCSAKLRANNTPVSTPV